VFIEAKDDGGGGDNWSYNMCKAPVKSSPPTNQHPDFLQAGCPSCCPTNSVRALNGKCDASLATNHLLVTMITIRIQEILNRISLSSAALAVV